MAGDVVPLVHPLTLRSGEYWASRALPHTNLASGLGITEANFGNMVGD